MKLLVSNEQVLKDMQHILASDFSVDEKVDWLCNHASNFEEASKSDTTFFGKLDDLSEVLEQKIDRHFKQFKKEKANE